MPPDTDMHLILTFFFSTSMNFIATDVCSKSCQWEPCHITRGGQWLLIQCCTKDLQCLCIDRRSFILVLTMWDLVYSQFGQPPMHPRAQLAGVQLSVGRSMQKQRFAWDTTCWLTFNMSQQLPTIHFILISIFNIYRSTASDTSAICSWTTTLHTVLKVNAEALFLNYTTTHRALQNIRYWEQSELLDAPLPFFMTNISTEPHIFHQPVHLIPRTFPFTHSLL